MSFDINEKIYLGTKAFIETSNPERMLEAAVPLAHTTVDALDHFKMTPLTRLEEDAQLMEDYYRRDHTQVRRVGTMVLARTAAEAARLNPAQTCHGGLLKFWGAFDDAIRAKKETGLNARRRDVVIRSVDDMIVALLGINDQERAKVLFDNAPLSSSFRFGPLRTQRLKRLVGQQSS